MIFKDHNHHFLSFCQNVSLRFENDYIHEIEYSWSVNIDNAGPILAVYCVYYSMQSPAIFQNIFKFCTFLCKFSNILPFFWKIPPILLLSWKGTAKGNCTMRDCTITVLNQYHKLRNIEMKRLCMVKQKTVETLQIWEKSGRIPPIDRKGSCKIKIT